MADLSAQVEEFLRNALRQKKLEDRLIRQALRDLRQTLIAVERVMGSSGVLSVGPNRERTIQAVVTAVAKSVQDSFGVPQLAALQEALTPFVEQQLGFARRMVTMAGGELVNEGAVAASGAQVQRIVNDAVVAGKTLSTQLSSALPALVADRVERFIRLGLSDVGGETFATYQDAVVRTTENNVEALIRTGVHEVGSAAQQAIYEFETDPAWMGPEGLVWTAVLDSNVCPICLKLDGKRFPTEYRKVSPHPQCVLGDTPVIAGSVAAAVRSVYSGNVVTIGTHGGRNLSVTENHPVLTANGWKPAKAITEGDQLVCHGIPNPVASVNPDLNQRPTTAEELFTLALQQPSVEIGAVPAAAMDFHGDGAGMHGEVNIACVNRELLLHGQSPCAKHVGQALLVGADVQLTDVVDLSTLDAFLFAMHAAATGLVSASDLLAALLRGELTPLEGLRLALAARCDARFDEPLADGAACDSKALGDLVLAQARSVQLDNDGNVHLGPMPDLNACGVKAGFDGVEAAPLLLHDFGKAQAGLVELDNVISVEIGARHEIPVYDFSTLSGAYLADGIVVHNCRCYLLPWKWRSEDMTDPSGNKVPPKRPADGDGAEQALSFKVAAKQWVKDNPDTAQAIFGKKLGQRLVDGEIGFDKAVKLWSAPKKPPAT